MINDGWEMNEAVKVTNWIISSIVLLGYLAIMSACGADDVALDERHNQVVIPKNISGEKFVAVIETPVGEFRAISVDLANEKLDTLKEGSDYVVSNFLPHPVNQATIPVPAASDMEKIVVWVVGRSVRAGDTLSVDPIALLEYTLEGESRSEILAIPRDSAMQTIHVENFSEFIIEYDGVKYLLEGWLRNRHGLGKVSQLNWKDQVKAQNFINARLEGL